MTDLKAWNSVMSTEFKFTKVQKKTYIEKLLKSAKKLRSSFQLYLSKPDQILQFLPESKFDLNKDTSIGEYRDYLLRFEETCANTYLIPNEKQDDIKIEELNIWDYESKLKFLIYHLLEHRNLDYLCFAFTHRHLLSLNEETLKENKKETPMDHANILRLNDEDLLENCKKKLSTTNSQNASGYDLGECPNPKCRSRDLGFKIDQTSSGDEGYTVKVFCKQKTCTNRVWVLQR